GYIQLCTGESIELTGSPYNSELNCSWSNGNKTEKFTVNETGTYRYGIMDKYGCGSEDMVTVIVGDKLDVDIIGDTVICSGSQILLKPRLIKSGYKYKWSSGETVPEITVSNGGKYVLEVESSSGCKGSDSVNISEINSPKLENFPNGKITICKGDTLRIIANSDTPGCSYKWNTGERTKEIYISKSCQYTVIITNQFGCSDSGSVEVEEEIPPKPKISGGLRFCRGESVILSADKEYDSYLWQDGSTSKEIAAGKAGRYILRAGSQSGCYGWDSVDVEELELPEVNIIGDTSLCRGQSVTLSAVLDFESYKWSNGERSKDIVIESAGEYSIEVRNTNGCIGRDTITVHFIDSKLDYPKELLFGTVKTYSQNSLSIILRNLGERSITINNLFMKNTLLEFKIIKPAPPVEIPAGDSIEITVAFEPEKAGKYFDSLIIETELPCVEKYSIAVSGEAEINCRIFVWLPDTTAYVGDDNFHIPLRAIITNVHCVLENFSFKAELRINSKSFWLDTSYSIALISSDIFGSEWKIELEKDNLNFVNNSCLLTDLKGLTLLGDSDMVALQIADFTFHDKSIETVTKSGSLKLVGYCKPGLRKIRFFQPTILTVMPNPFGDELNAVIESSEEGLFNLNIFNSSGGKLKSFNWESYGKDTYSYTIDMKDLAGGIYFFVLRTPENVITIPAARMK
ncbi:MAG: hypothetical protein QG635_1841, partial [Bacteroidota bacterium]|nr:hypothetical protein [Bacteroidota bacterium]